MQEEKQYGMTTGESAQNVDPSSEQYQAQESPSGKKKSVIGKVKDKAKKFKSKMKAKKPGSGEGGSSSSGEEEEDSDQSPVSSESSGLQRDLHDEKEDRGLKADKFQSPPPPPAAVVVPATDDVEERFGELNLGPKAHKIAQDSLPAAAADIPVEEGKDSQGRDVAPDQEPIEHPKTAEVAGIAGVEALSQKETSPSEQVARDPTEGDNVQGEKQEEGQSQPTITSRAANSVYGLKDTLASKLGYGASSPTKPSAETDQTPDDTNPPPITTRAANTVLGLKDTVASKLGYGTGSSPTGTHPEETAPEETSAAQKSYIQKVQDTAYGAKDAVVSKLGYNSEQSEASKLEQYESPSRFHPGVEDKALSTIITDAMSNSATTVKNSVMSPFGGSNTGSPKPSSDPKPSSTPPPAASEPSDVAT